MRSSILVASAFLLAACGTARSVLDRDSTRVEVKTEVVTVRDTAWVELPVIVEKVQTLDTCSVLENKYAKSEASVSAGVLAHTLEINPVREPVMVEKQIVYRDSLVYVDRVQIQTVEVEKHLTRWQQVKMKAGFVAILLLAIRVLHFIFLIINNLKPKLQ